MGLLRSHHHPLRVESSLLLTSGMSRSARFLVDRKMFELPSYSIALPLGTLLTAGQCGAGAILFALSAFWSVWEGGGGIAPGYCGWHRIRNLAVRLCWRAGEWRERLPKGR
jgi:hypothetical protein